MASHDLDAAQEDVDIVHDDCCIADGDKLVLLG